jgi:multicomponent Na+:H+ antiporter subunit G
MDIVISWIGTLCLLLGSVLAVVSGIGVLRFPDFYTRMHAVGVSDTLVTALILVGLMLQNPDGLVIIKLLMILLMTLFINPTASHALAKAALKSGLSPKLAKKDRGKSENPSFTSSS